MRTRKNYSEKNVECDIMNKTLIARIQSGDTNALTELCTKNAGFVTKKASMLKGYMFSDLELKDLVNEGFIGLIEASKRFDITRNVSFFTYADYWILQHMMRANKCQGHLIRIPEHMTSVIKRLLELDDLYSYMEKSEKYKTIADIMDVSTEKIEELYQISNFLYHASLDNDDDHTSLDNKLSDTSDFTEQVISKTLTEQLEKAINKLSEKEQNILKRRFGFSNDNEPETLENIAKDYNVTRERIRFIEAKALRRLSRMYEVKKLKDYLYT